jgi:hypothetical protein
LASNERCPCVRKKKQQSPSISTVGDATEIFSDPPPVIIYGSGAENQTNASHRGEKRRTFLRATFFPSNVGVNRIWHRVCEPQPFA